MERTDFEAIIKEINEAECYSVHYVDEDCELFANAKPELVAKGLDVDTHRWYECSTNVYKIGEWFLGVFGVSNIFSESMGYNDCDFPCVAFEMEKIPSYTYQKIKENEHEHK